VGGPLWRHTKSKAADGCHFENRQYAITRSRIIRSSSNFAGRHNMASCGFVSISWASCYVHSVIWAELPKINLMMMMIVFHINLLSLCIDFCRRSTITCCWWFQALEYSTRERYICVISAGVSTKTGKKRTYFSNVTRTLTAIVPNIRPATRVIKSFLYPVPTHSLAHVTASPGLRYVPRLMNDWL